MNKIATILGLTWKAAFRYRLFWILCALLAAAVVGLPVLIKDDGTAQGMVQILLTYTLSSTAALLGFATLWLSCGTLARDVEECQMQMVAVKPIARWQIWLGKWLGLLSLNAVLLALAGAAIFFLLHWRAGRLPPDQQKILRDDIFVSRASARERIPDLTADIDANMKRLVKDPSTMSGFDQAELRKQVTEALKSRYTDLAPGMAHTIVIDLHSLQDRLRNRQLQLRVKFQIAVPTAENEYTTFWRIGPPNSTRQIEFPERFPADSFQIFPIPPNLLDDQGKLWIEVGNPNGENLTFPLGEGIELLYPESTFAINFGRGLVIIFCWLALLASIGLAAASSFSFPVAAFVSLAVLFIGLSSGTVATVVEQGTITGYDAASGGYGHTVVDYLVVPIFRGALKIINLVQDFSPIDSLSSGRSIRWGQLGLAVLQIVVVLGGIFC
ncbi:MAG TPA: ABC transporter permease subunit, partial [Candidatus Cybelea sp.]|nr:ABC transporter permease subunit [Candidatus Cybelea sp.]